MTLCNMAIEGGPAAVTSIPIGSFDYLEGLDAEWRGLGAGCAVVGCVGLDSDAHFDDEVRFDAAAVFNRHLGDHPWAGIGVDETVPT